MKYKPVFFLLLYLSLFVPGISFGSGVSLFTEVMHDFAPLPAEVLKVDTGLVTVDCGTHDGVSTGDLFQVYRRGSPVSAGQGAGVIGYLKEPFALLRVDGVKAGRADCSVINARGRIVKGMPVMRFSDMTALLVITSGSGKNETLQRRFSDMLPALKWLDGTEIPGPVKDAAGMAANGIDLLFSLSTHRLVIHGPGYVVIRSYPLSEEPFRLDHASASEPATALSRSSDAARTLWNKTGMFQWDDNQVAASAADIHGWKTAGHLSGSANRVEIVDMDGDGRSEAVYLMPRALYVFPFRMQGQLLSWEVNGPGRAVGFYVSDTGGWIVVNVLMEGTGLRSALLRYQHDGLVIVQDDINLWLSFHNLNGKGAHDTLLGQTFDLRAVWGDKIYTLDLSSQGIEYLQEISLPRDFRTGWGEWGDIDGNGRQELCIVDRSGRIWLYEDGMLRWSSAGVFSSGGEMTMPFLAADIYGDGHPDMLLAGPVRGEVETTGDIICFIKWDNGKFQIGPVTMPVNAVIAGLSVSDRSLLVAVRDNAGENDNDEKGVTVLYQQSLPLPRP